MKFKINNDTWEILNQSTSELLDKCNTMEEQHKTYIYGVTIYKEHIIIINKDMCIEQQIKTLKHELTHCYIWNYGLYNVPNFTHEMVCDLVSSINDFINEIVNQYKESIFNELEDIANTIHEEKCKNVKEEASD